MKRVKNIIRYWCNDTVSGCVRGKGVYTAILDSGIVTHPDLNDRIAGFVDICGGRKELYDDNGHGTHVAGIICGTGRLSQGAYQGIAPESNVIAIKVLDQKGNGDIPDVIRGIQWVLKHKDRFPIRIVNISVGTLPNINNEDEKKLLEYVEALWDAGLIVVAAAGNYGPGTGTVTTPGISKKVITVGSSDDQKFVDYGGRRKSNYSGRGPTEECVCKPDVVAPGSYIYSCCAGYRMKNAKPYLAKSGTSMSTPIVSGAVALLLSKYPDMTNMEVKLRLRQSCDNLGYSQNRQGWGQINIKRLLEQ